MSLISVCLIFVFALKHAELKSLLSNLVWRHTPSVDYPKTYFSMTAKKMLKRVRAKTHTYFTPLQMSNNLLLPRVVPSQWSNARISFSVHKGLGRKCMEAGPHPPCWWWVPRERQKPIQLCRSCRSNADLSNELSSELQLQFFQYIDIATNQWRFRIRAFLILAFA